MSDARTIPGQSIFKRLCARGMRRMNIGPSPVFYERFGLQDPWSMNPQFDVGEDNEMFSFLSAQPYYARLRAQQSAAARARRRLLGRIGAASSTRLAKRAARRMTGAKDAGAWLKLSKASHFAPTIHESSLIFPEPQGADFEEEVEAEVAKRTYTSSRKARKRVTRSRQAAPIDSQLLRALRQLGLKVRGDSREEIMKVIDQVRALPEQQQATATRRAVRRIRGSVARVARLVVEEAAEHVEAKSARLTDVARNRTASVTGRKVAGARPTGFRPVLSSSPAMTALQFEEPIVEETVEARPARPRSSRKPAVRQTAHRDVPAARVAREVRTQQVTGRAGPTAAALDSVSSSDFSIPTADAPVAHRAARPTARIARQSIEVAAPAVADTRRGLAATGTPVAKRARAASHVARVAARSVAPAIVEEVSAAPVARRRVRLSASPVSYLDLDEPSASAPSAVSRVARRSRFVAPAEVSAQTAPTERAAARLTATVQPRRRSLMTATPTAYVSPVSYEATEIEEAAAPAARTYTRATGTTVKTPRAARGVEASTSAPITRRSLRRSAAADAFVDDSSERSFPVSSARTFTTPSVRAYERAAVETREDSRGASLVSPSVSAHVRTKPARASRLWAPNAVPVSPVGVDASPELEAEPAARRPASRPATRTHKTPAGRTEASAPAARPTRRAASRAVQSTETPVRRRAAVATVRAASRGVVAPRVDKRGRVQLTRSPTDYLKAETAAPQTAGRRTIAPSPVIGAKRSRRMAAIAPTAVTLEPAHSEQEVEAAPAARRSQTSRILDRAQAAAPTIWEQPTAAAPEVQVARSRRAEAAASEPSVTRRSRVVAPTATPVQPVGVEAAPVDEAIDAPRRTARRQVAPVRAAAERATTAPLVRQASGRIVKARGAVASTAMNAVARLEANRPTASAATFRTPVSARSVGARSQRVARRPMAHLSTDFGWLQPDVPEVQLPAIGQTGPVRRADLTGVLRQVNAAVRAAERAEVPVVVGHSARRTIAPEAVASTTSIVRPRLAQTQRGQIVRAARNIAFEGAQVVLTGTATEAEQVFEAAPRRSRARHDSRQPVAWAESRAATSAAHSSAPAVRTIRRVLPASMVVVDGQQGQDAAELAPTATPIRRAARRQARAEVPLLGRRSTRRPLVQQNARGKYTPRAGETVATPTFRTRKMSTFGLGTPALPVALDADVEEVLTAQERPRAGRSVSTLDRTLSYMTAAPAKSFAAQPVARKALRASRSSFDNKGRLVPNRRTRRPQLSSATEAATYAASAGVELGEVIETIAAAPGAPNWAKRAVHGHTAGAPEYASNDRHGGANLGAGMLTALARAGNPEEIIQVILERSEGMRSFTSDLPSNVAHLVERIVQMGDEAKFLDPAADRGETRDARNIQRDDVFKPIYRGNVQDDPLADEQGLHTLSRGKRGVRRGAPGASQAMKMADKLQKLILLAESDRRAAQDHVRMAEGAPGGGGEAGGGQATSTAEDARSMKVLQRDVLQAVMRELELNLMRNQGDPDGWF